MSDLREDHTSLATTTGHIVSMADGDNTSIFRVFRWIIATEAHQVFVVTTFVATYASHLCRTRFSTHMEIGIPCLFTETLLVVHHAIENRLDVFQWYAELNIENIDMAAKLADVNRLMVQCNKEDSDPFNFTAIALVKKETTGITNAKR